MAAFLLAGLLLGADTSRSVSVDRLAQILTHGEQVRQFNLKQAAKAGNRKQVKDLQALKGRYFPRMGPNLRVGDVGLSPVLTVQQIVDDRNMIVEWGGERCWLRGLSSAGTPDEARVYSNVPLIVTGTKHYTTVLGASKTILLIEPLEFTPADLYDAWEKVTKAKRKLPDRPY